MFVWTYMEINSGCMLGREYVEGINLYKCNKTLANWRKKGIIGTSVHLLKC